MYKRRSQVYKLITSLRKRKEELVVLIAFEVALLACRSLSFLVARAEQIKSGYINSEE
jgi:hypothetical protein